MEIKEWEAIVTFLRAHREVSPEVVTELIIQACDDALKTLDEHRSKRM